MTRKNFGPLAAATIVFIALVCLLSGCGQSNSTKDSSSKHDPASFYNQVQLNQSKDAVGSALGVSPENEDGYYNYIDPNTGFGVRISYNDSNQVTGKWLYALDSDLPQLNNATVTAEQAAAITAGMTYDEVTSMLGGEGMEFACVQNPSDDANPITMRVWINDDGTVLYVTFIGTKGTVASSKFFSK